MSDSEYERAVLWVPDPSSPAGWIRRKVWAQDEPKPKKRPMGFGVAVQPATVRTEDSSRA